MSGYPVTFKIVHDWTNYSRGFDVWNLVAVIEDGTSNEIEVCEVHVDICFGERDEHQPSHVDAMRVIASRLERVLGDRGNG